MPNPLPLRNVHGRKDIGFQKNTAQRPRPVHSLGFRSRALLWSSPTNTRSELVPVSDLTMFWFEETRQCFLWFFFSFMREIKLECFEGEYFNYLEQFLWYENGVIDSCWNTSDSQTLGLVSLCSEKGLSSRQLGNPPRLCKSLQVSSLASKTNVNQFK